MSLAVPPSASPPTDSARAGEPARGSVVLVVEDNPGDVALTREALAEDTPVGGRYDVHDVPTGDAALAFLRRDGRFHDAPRPDLVLLDLNLPGLGGTQVLESIRRDPALADLAVVVLSSSDAEADVARARSAGADAYVSKAVDLDTHLDRVREVARRWARPWPRDGALA